MDLAAFTVPVLDGSNIWIYIYSTVGTELELPPVIIATAKKGDSDSPRLCNTSTAVNDLIDSFLTAGEKKYPEPAKNGPAPQHWRTGTTCEL